MEVLQGRAADPPLRLRADAVVVGTGAGGSMVARELARAGLSVVALEEGPFSATADFTREEGPMLELLYQDRGARASSDLAIRILQGRGVGGSTVHNTNLCKRTPPEILEQWERRHGVLGASAADMAPLFEATERDLGVTAIAPAQVNRNNAVLQRGVEALGYRGGLMAHNRHGCVGSGYCELGCPFDAKQNALKVLLPEAAAAGARVVSDARVLRVVTRRGRATGVRGALLDAGGRPRGTFAVDAPAVVLAGSAVGSAALHQRSGLPDPSGQVGRNLAIHPGAVVAGVFDEEVVGWQGIPQTYECTEFLDFSAGARRCVWLISAFAHPIGTAALVPGFGAAHTELMRRYRHVAVVTAMIHDRSVGRVRVAGGGRLRVDYRLHDHDREQLAFGLTEAARILLAAGARRVAVPYEPDPLWIDGPEQLEAIAARGVTEHRLGLVAVHPMGTLRMGADRRRAVVDSWGAHHAVEGVYVADGSLFPTSIGGPPQVSIYTFARRVAGRMVETLGG